MVARKPGSPGRARNKPLKPLRREGRNRSGEPVVANLRVFYFYTQGCGRIGRPVFPAPSVLEGWCLEKLGRFAPRERKGVSQWFSSFRDAHEREPGIHFSSIVRSAMDSGSAPFGASRNDENELFET
jgi:hypothetical protein